MTRSPGQVRTPRGYAATKRVIDLGVCLVALPILLPIGLLCAVLIRLESPGPILFAQQRTGQHGVRFPMFKFRTMVQNAEELEGLAPAPQHPAARPISRSRTTRGSRASAGSCARRASTSCRSSST